MKGLFQCPPRASPWVITDANLSPCKGKSFQKTSKALYSAKCRKSVRKLLISVSFVHFCLIYIKKMQKRHTFLAKFLVNSRNSSNFAASKG